MFTLLTICIAIAVALVSLLVVVFCIECLAALLPQPKRLAPHERGRVAVLLPAHNEEAVLGETLSTLNQQIRKGDRVVVVADNCTDATVSIAYENGAEVLQRHDPVNRGKGFALRVGLAHLRQDDQPFDAIVILDADCQVHVGCIDQLASAVVASSRPVQASYLMTPGGGSLAKQAISQFAVLVKNHVRPRGLRRLGLPCLLTGSGMAFPPNVAWELPLEGGHIVEDMQLTFDLLVAGHPSRYCEAARVDAVLPPNDDASGQQRTRWEHGHLQVLTSQVPRLLLASLKRADLRIAAMALDLAVPPLSLLVMAWIATGAAAAGIAWWEPRPLFVLLAAGGLLAVCIASVWWRFARHAIPLRRLASAPAYALAKAPMYLKFLAKRQRSWVRTARE